MKCIYCHSDVELLEPGYGWVENEDNQFFHLECAEMYMEIKVYPQGNK